MEAIVVLVSVAIVAVVLIASRVSLKKAVEKNKTQLEDKYRQSTCTHSAYGQTMFNLLEQALTALSDEKRLELCHNIAKAKNVTQVSKQTESSVGELLAYDDVNEFLKTTYGTNS